MDWTGCEYVEQMSNRAGGAPVVRNTGVTAESVLESFEEGQSALEIAWKYRLAPTEIQGVLAFAFKEDQPGYPVLPVSTVAVPQVDWEGCEYVEIIEGKVSGTPLLRGTRVPADVVWECAVAGYLVPEIAHDYTLTPSEVEGLLAWALARTGLKQAS